MTPFAAKTRIVSRLTALGTFAAGLVAYGTLLTQSYDYNIVPWVVHVQNADLSDPGFFHMQHLLHLPTEWVVYQVWRLFGYTQGAVLPMQWTSALLGSITAAVFFLLLDALTDDLPIALLTTAGWMFSFQTWTLHTDAWYHPLGNLFVLLTAWLLLRPRGADPGTPREHRLIGIIFLAALTMGLAALFSQLALFFAPGMFLAVLLGPDLRTNRSRVREGVVFAAVAAAIIVLAYLLVSLAFLGHRTPADPVSWFQGTHGDLPRWGRWEWERIPESVVNSLAAFVPLTVGIRLRALLEGQILWPQIIAQLSVFVFLLAVLLLVLTGWRWRKTLWSTHRQTLVVCLTWLVPLTLFASWYEPDGLPITLPAFSLWTLAALVLAAAGRAEKRGWRTAAIFAGTGLAIALLLGNLLGAVYPRHANPSPDYTKAAQAAAQMSPQDMLITLHWDWSTYLPLFPQRQSVSLLMLSQGRMSHQQIAAFIHETISQTHQQGGRALMVDAGRYTDAEWQWLLQDGGLEFSRADFDSIPKRIAWTFPDGEIVWEILGALPLEQR